MLGGAYPGHREDAKTASNAKQLAASGVGVFLNLMELDETDHRGRPFPPYAHRVESELAASGGSVAVHRTPIRHLSVPDEERMAQIQDVIDRALAEDRTVYVHCWGGRGRTGTVIGIHLIRHGLADPDDFVETIEWLRRGDVGGGPSPETEEQVEFVRTFTKSRG